MLSGHKLRLACEPVKLIPRKRAGGFSDVGFRVTTPLTQSKKFEKLAREIFVWLTLHIFVRVEIKHHRRVFTDLMRQCFKISKCLLAEQGVLLMHQQRRLHFLYRSRKVTVPEQRHLLPGLSLARQHPVEPKFNRFKSHLALLQTLLALGLAARHVSFLRRQRLVVIDPPNLHEVAK